MANLSGFTLIVDHKDVVAVEKVDGGRIRLRLVCGGEIFLDPSTIDIAKQKINYRRYGV